MGFIDKFNIYAFSLFTVICQVFFLAWVGDKIKQMVRFLNENIYSLSHSIPHFIIFQLLCLIEFNSRMQSSTIGDGMYRSNWYNGKVKYQKLIPLITIRSQNLEKLTRYKFAEVSYDSFADVIS